MSIIKNGLEAFVGCVTETWEFNDYRIMSDMYTWAKYAKVWNDATHSLETVLVSVYKDDGTWTEGRASVDATPATLEKVERHKKQEEMKKNEKRIAQSFRLFEKGKIIKVYKGRKVPIGTIGKIFWIGTQRFGNSTSIKLGIALNDQKNDDSTYKNVVWVDAANCKVIGSDGEYWQQVVAQYAFMSGLEFSTIMENLGGSPEIAEKIKTISIEFLFAEEKGAQVVAPLLTSLLA